MKRLARSGTDAETLSRRLFLATGAGGLAAAAALAKPWTSALAAQKRAESVHGPLTITDIETHH
ncbi:MAG: hypothetical protein MK538_20185, partial [Planctomycetes bacterium]|nr:hypothetical protein [Planctomycetota bacterium]